jgi:hypothetical protein
MQSRVQELEIEMETELFVVGESCERIDELPHDELPRCFQKNVTEYEIRLDE